MATQTIDATLFASSHPDIAKRTSVSGLIISVGMMLVGILIFASIFEMSDKSSTLSMGLMVLGTAFVLLGVFRLFWKSKEVVYLPTGSVTKERSVFFDFIPCCRSTTSSGCPSTPNRAISVRNCIPAKSRRSASLSARATRSKRSTPIATSTVCGKRDRF